MDDRDRAIVAAAEERDRRHFDRRFNDEDEVWVLADDRRELLRIVREQQAAIDFAAERVDHALALIAEDRADDAAAERATAGKWK